MLLEQELVSHGDVRDQVCPVILDLTEPDAIDYYKTEAVAVSSAFLFVCLFVRQVSSARRWGQSGLPLKDMGSEM